MEDVVFGVIGSVSLAAERIPMINSWWLQGAVGCYVVEGEEEGDLEQTYVELLPQGLKVTCVQRLYCD